MNKALQSLFRGVRVAGNQAPGIIDKNLNDDTNYNNLSPADAQAPSGIRRNHSCAGRLSTLPEKQTATFDLALFKQSAVGGNIKASQKDNNEDKRSKISLQPELQLDKIKVIEELKEAAAKLKTKKPPVPTKPDDVFVKTFSEKIVPLLNEINDGSYMKRFWYNAALCYEVKGDYKNAISYYFKAGRKGCKESYFRASAIYELGKGDVKADVEIAHKCLNWAALLGHKIARHNTAAKLLDQTSLSISDERRAYFYLQQNIDDGVVKSMNFLGCRLLKKENKSKEDDEDAVRYLTLAAEKNYAPSLHNLAICHLNGIGVSKPDKQQAYTLLKRSCKLNYPASMKILAELLEQGSDQGIKQDLTTATSLRKRAQTINQSVCREKIMNSAFESAGYKNISEISC